MWHVGDLARDCRLKGNGLEHEGGTAHNEGKSKAGKEGGGKKGAGTAGSCKVGDPTWSCGRFGHTVAERVWSCLIKKKESMGSGQ